MGVTQAMAGEAPFTGKEAKRMLFSPKKTEFVVVPQDFMTDVDVKTLELMADMPEFKAVLYYGAVAASPKQGLAHKSISAVANHHSIKAAEAAAIKECNALRGGGPKCLMVAYVVPRKFSEQPLQLSASATTAFRKTYLKGRGAKAMAISPTTGDYAIAKGDGAAEAAVAACNKAASEKGATDCRVVIQDN
ncbi:5-aminolevulic acid synthase [Profundibacter sp.]|uniref:5-aminolevulic acid synthase n=1 Tax=Profundibacter sp. TaxID=3101071 RepID=UPI003D0ECF40